MVANGNSTPLARSVQDHVATDNESGAVEMRASPFDRSPNAGLDPLRQAQRGIQTGQNGGRGVFGRDHVPTYRTAHLSIDQRE